MKRIIDGATYNTDTSTAVAEAMSHDEGSRTTTESTLYQNRSGVYFHVDIHSTDSVDRNGEVITRTGYNWYVVGDVGKARAWCENHKLTITSDIEDRPDEAVVGEKMATIYLRVTPTLKRSIEDASSEDKMSGNLWASRCIERCLDIRDRTKLKSLAEIGVIAGMWDMANWDEKKYKGALEYISICANHLADDLTSSKGEMERLIESLRGSSDWNELMRSFNPYPHEID